MAKIVSYGCDAIVHMIENHTAIAVWCLCNDNIEYCSRNCGCGPQFETMVCAKYWDHSSSNLNFWNSSSEQGT